jgi:hypothetical protein
MADFRPGVWKMKFMLILSALAVLAAGLGAQPPRENLAERYRIPVDPDGFPQSTPKDALASVVKAMSNRQVDYLLAQLADPQYVDEEVKKKYQGKFSALVEEVTAKLSNDPGVVKKLRRYLEEGTWDVQDTSAAAQLKDVAEQVFLRRIGNRWFLENRNRPAGPAKER